MGLDSGDTMLTFINVLNDTARRSFKWNIMVITIPGIPVMQTIANFLFVQFPKYLTETRKKLSVVELLF